VTDRELDKNAGRRLAIIRHAQEVTGHVSLTCCFMVNATSACPIRALRTFQSIRALRPAVA
jgi:hypothetical protein